MKATYIVRCVILEPSNPECQIEGMTQHYDIDGNIYCGVDVLEFPYVWPSEPTHEEEQAMIDSKYNGLWKMVNTKSPEEKYSANFDIKIIRKRLDF